MLKRLAAFLAGCLLACSGVAHAQMMGVSGGPFAVSGGGYSGPGDIQALTAFWGFRAYNAAIVTAGTQALVNLRRSSDSHTCDIIVSALGGFGNTGNCSTGGDNGQAALAWATRSTFSGTISTTTLTTTGDPCTATAGDEITGAGITSYTKISSATSCAAGSGSYVISQSFTISVSETITDLIPTFVTELYDQTGSGWNIVQATAGNQPTVVVNCVNSLPCLQFTTSTKTLVAGSNFTPASGTLSVLGVAEWASGSNSQKILEENGLNNRFQASSGSSWALVGGSSGTLSATASTGAFHSSTGVISGASSVLAIDGAETTGTATGNTTAGAPGMVGGATTTADVAEAGFIDNVAISSTVRINLYNNMKAYYGTP